VGAEETEDPPVPALLTEALMDATEFATGLRQIADWYEAHPETALPYDEGGGALTVYTERDTKERAAEIARALGTAEKHMDAGSPYLRLVRSFNGVRLCFVFDRAAVCERRVVGQRTIPATPARDAQPEREEDIIEWNCHSILASSEPQATARE
jgi:hypothetical protein